jgi:glycosidase
MIKSFNIRPFWTKNKIILNSLVSAILIISVVSCKPTQGDKKYERSHVAEFKGTHPAWSENAVIYEVNIRQYTPEGTIKAFSNHLPQLKELGVDILWLMPIFPIGETNRKGSLGSYYSIKDYKKLNPEFGSISDLADLVKQAHALNMYVIIDWVGNHSAFDNPLFTEHREWYKQDSLGKPVSPLDWTDVVQLNYDKPELRRYMTDALKFWVTETNIDGYRCDVAGWVPCNFWDSARTVLEQIKPVFMLAEDQDHTCLVEKAFDMNYSWTLLHTMNNIAKGKANADTLKAYFEKEDSIFDPAIYRMNFITNHDENSWSGTEFERLGDAVEVYSVLTFTVPGMPLIYNGQEMGMNRRLRFFDKDTIPWENNKWFQTYKKLVELKKGHSIFWNGTFGGSFKIIDMKSNKDVFVFYRENKNEKGLVLLNLSNKPVEFQLENKKLKGNFTDYFTSKTYSIKGAFNLPAYGYLVLLKE